MELWHRFQTSFILMKWNNCFPLVSPDKLDGCCWTPHLSPFNYNCKLFLYFQHYNQVGFNYNYFSAHLEDEIKMVCFPPVRREKQSDSESREGGGGEKKTRKATIGFWPWASPPLKRLWKRQEGLCVCVCVSLSCPVCVLSKCVCQLLCCCHLKRKREADAFKPSGIQWYKDAHVKCLPLIWIHVKMPPHSTRAM